MKGILLERGLRGDAARSYRKYSTIGIEHLKKILLERELRGDTAGSCRSRATEAAIEVEHLKRVWVERELRGEGGGSKGVCSEEREEDRSGTGVLRNLTTPL